MVCMTVQKVSVVVLVWFLTRQSGRIKFFMTLLAVN